MSEEKLPPAIAADQVYRLRVFYEDTDAGGVVYYANYLKFAERARSELLRAFGVSQKALAEAGGPIFTVRRVEADFLRPAYLDDELEVRTTVLEHGGARVAMGQVIGRDQEDLVRMRVEIACVNAKGRATRIPEPVAGLFADAVAHGSSGG
ncbi:MAG: tol-pal system-associated acyl-CoA thioesterase [Alphaproteobacteria bacterium]|nr:tol-pal system-associated acyl-CoA thioesterase [Alphaproteobacteria bacterium]MCZ6609620.1 tol-pal system-associated acyl-CoA thioesterase [Alphaproteobacteria bacterium]MCZ6814730.1 tol-pal system-associated acyl-CoA thioesterase [Alphaproteobacteria bacterium]MCZ6849413.1 tol-pal system-associated acyl-CoA thioesterase [Alphaproteobacteria bacterium]